LFDVLCARDGATVGALSLDAIVAHMRSMSSRGSLPSGGVVVDATAFARDVFIAADRNRNHLLTHKELRSYCEANSGVAQRLFGSHFAWHDVFTDVSTEQAGEFNESEFTNFVAACIGATTAAANDLDGVCSAIETAFTERDSLAKDEWITSVVEISVQHGGPDAVMRVCSQLSRLHAALSAQLVDTHDRVATELAEATDKASHHETNHATAQASMSELEQTHATELQVRDIFYLLYSSLTHTRILRKSTALQSPSSMAPTFFFSHDNDSKRTPSSLLHPSSRCATSTAFIPSSFVASRSAPAARSRATHRRWPFRAAACSGVSYRACVRFNRLRRGGTTGFGAAFASFSSISSTAACPFKAAQWSAVRAHLSRASTIALTFFFFPAAAAAAEEPKHG
jgi:hypothetical protein